MPDSQFMLLVEDHSCRAWLEYSIEGSTIIIKCTAYCVDVIIPLSAPNMFELIEAGLLACPNSKNSNSRGQMARHRKCRLPLDQVAIFMTPLESISNVLLEWLQATYGTDAPEIEHQHQGRPNLSRIIVDERAYIDISSTNGSVKVYSKDTPLRNLELADPQLLDKLRTELDRALLGGPPV
jgi:hypothetical protein